MAFPHLRSIFVERDIPYPMQAVLDSPVATIEFQGSTGRGAVRTKVGDAVGVIGSLFARLGKEDMALDQEGLTYMGEIQETIERGGGADSAFFDASVAFIERAVLRGGKHPNRRL